MLFLFWVFIATNPALKASAYVKRMEASSRV